MKLDYLEGNILGVSATAGELVIRLDQEERGADSGVLVLSLRLKNSSRSQDAGRVLSRHIYDWAEIYFQEESGEKYLEISIEYAEAVEDVRIDYAHHETVHETYALDDLKMKLEHLQQHFISQVEYYDKEATRLQSVIYSLRQELCKEIDRFTRKRDFFEGSDKAEKYEIELECHQKILKLLDRFDNSDAV
jgi:hypothetical protein